MFFSDMFDVGIVDDWFYVVFVVVYGKVGFIDNVNKILEMMKVLGVEVSIIFYNIFINIYSKVEVLEKVCVVL